MGSSLDPQRDSLDEFDPEIVDRAAVRKELGIPSDVPVLGNVGRFSSQKNPSIGFAWAPSSPGSCLIVISCWWATALAP